MFRYTSCKWSCAHTHWNFPYHYQHSVGKLHSTRCYSWWIIVNRYESLLIIRDTIISNEWPLRARRRRITCIAIDSWSCSWLFNVRYVDLEVSLQFHVRNVNLRTRACWVAQRIAREFDGCVKWLIIIYITPPTQSSIITTIFDSTLAAAVATIV